MQSETADFTPVPPSGVLDESDASFFILVPFVLLCENMTLSTKPEVHDILRCRQKRTKPRPPVTCTENLVKFGPVILGIYDNSR